jgi:hypothetical protein
VQKNDGPFPTSHAKKKKKKKNKIKLRDFLSNLMGWVEN